MQLVTSGLTKRSASTKFWQSSIAISAAIVLALTVIFTLDRAIANAPVQHLYYLPIILAAFRFGRRGGVAVSIVAIVLYHLANKPFVGYRYGELDIIQIALFIGVGVITAKLKDDATRLHILATTDDLTGLHNLRSFEEHLTRIMGESRETKTPISILVLDVDRLKSLNDTYGHLCGAEAVRTVGAIIGANTPAGAVACRYGGDEFVVAFPSCTRLQAQAIADDIRKAVHAKASVLAGHAMPAGTLSVSIGIASRSTVGDEERPETLFHAADQALYVAKANGRNRIYAASELVSEVSSQG
jgi:diguanylate cyclase (GGDEF)-like protein